MATEIIIPDFGSKDRASWLAIESPGGTQALKRSEPVDVVVAGTRGTVMRPTLAGAIVAKAIAVVELGHPKHLRDLSLLLTLVEDPTELKDEVTASEKKRLRAITALRTLESANWLDIPNAERGVFTYLLVVS